MAVSNIANQIRNGEIEVGLAVGFESMSATYVILPWHSFPAVVLSPATSTAANSLTSLCSTRTVLIR